MITSCYSAATQQIPAQSLEPSPTSIIPFQTAIPLAYQETDPRIRRTAILPAVRALLLDPDYANLSDEIVSEDLTNLAFSSNELILSDLAFVRRHGSLAVVALPDGLGIYFFDLDHASQAPLELTRWAAGLQSLEVVWQDDSIGVAYHTLDLEGKRHAHTVLLTRADSSWSGSWISDDIPDWWFNTTNASAAFSPDLSVITVIGESTDTTQSFEETSQSPQRTFRLVWKLDGTQYQATIPSAGFRDRNEWAWATAIPSPYATLVEFVERFQRNDIGGARRLAANDMVMADADNFGLALTGVPYKAEVLDETHIRITGHQGALIITFQALQSSEEDWLIANIGPQGAVNP